MSSVQKVAGLLERAGVLRVLEGLPTCPGILVFNHHRVGNREMCAYDRDVFSATQDQIDAQVGYIKRHFPLLLPAELEEVMTGRRRLTRMHAMITFDDGYRDNYEMTFPVLEAHGAKAVFFLVPTFLDTATIPWWDEISYLVRHTAVRELRVPTAEGERVVAIPTAEHERAEAIAAVLGAYKSLPDKAPDRFLERLRVEAGGMVLPPAERRFLNWEEARTMQRAGMEMGGHTHTHPFLSRLTAEEQFLELSLCKQALDAGLLAPVTSLAYPNGSPRDFSEDTKRAAERAGFRSAFSYYGGVNGGVPMDRYDLLRSTPDPQIAGFRAKTVLTTRLTWAKGALRKVVGR